MRCFTLVTRATTAQSARAWGIFAVGLSMAACQPAPGTSSGSVGAEKPLQFNQDVATVLPLQRGYIAREFGYKAMQFNFVASSSEGAVRLWNKLGFATVGRLPKAFRHPSKGFVDALVMYKWLET